MIPNLAWRWEDSDGLFAVEVDAVRGVLHWSGEQKENGSTPRHALWGFGRDQSFEEFLTAPAIACPPDVRHELRDTVERALWDNIKRTLFEEVDALLRVVGRL